MPANRRLLDQFCTILSDAQGIVPTEPLPTQFLADMSSERIRIGKTDWQGRRASTMLWHFADLKPAVQVVVAEHVVDRWHAYRQDMSAHGGASMDGKEEAGPPSAAVQPDAERRQQPEKTTPTVRTEDERQRNPARRPIMRRDWFDRLTDWVAAVVTLWN